MSATEDPVTEPLLKPLDQPQRALLDVVGEVVAATRSWPIYQYVEAKMDDRGLDADAVISSMPSISRAQLTYSLVRRDRSNSPETPVKLTIAGMAHLPAFAPTVDMFLRVLAELRARRAAAAYDPTRVIEVIVSGTQLVKDLQLADEPLVALLPDLLDGEPSTWHGSGGTDADGWTHKPSTWLRRFDDIHDVGDYLDRLRAWILPTAPPTAPVLSSPLSLVAAFDYLDIVWRLRFKQPLLVVPSAERAARLAFDATTADEFDNRLSALGEMLKGLRVPGDQKQRTLQRLDPFLASELPTEAMARVKPAIATLQRITHIRNGGQHIGASTQAAAALPAFGLSFPITDHTTAWQAVQAHAVAALDTIREEIRATA